MNTSTRCLRPTSPSERPKEAWPRRLLRLAAQLAGEGVAAEARERSSLLGSRHPVSSADTVVCPRATRPRTIAWGDPIADGPEFRQDASNTPPIRRSSGACTTTACLLPDRRLATRTPGAESRVHGRRAAVHRRVANWSAEKTSKSPMRTGSSSNPEGRDDKRGRGHGNDDDWHGRASSKYARRITGQTPIRTAVLPPAILGCARARTPPAARCSDAQQLRHGFTPWGTSWRVEENFNGYFQKTVAKPKSLDRDTGRPLGSASAPHHSPADSTPTSSPMSPTLGWVSRSIRSSLFDAVERTALGRIKHEGAWVRSETRPDRRLHGRRRATSTLPLRSKKPCVSVRRGVSPLDEGTLLWPSSRPTAPAVAALTPDNPRCRVDPQRHSHQTRAAAVRRARR